MPNLPFPLIQGTYYDHSSCDIKVNGTSYFGFKSLSWSDGLEPGEIFGNGSAQKIAETRGQYKAEASAEVWRAHWDQIVQSILSGPNVPAGTGLYEARFNIDITLNPEGGLAPVTDNLVSCRIKKPSKQTQIGNEGLAVKIDLTVMYILANGVNPLTNMKF